MSDQEILNKRNIAALDEAAKRDRARVDELQAIVTGLQATVAMLTNQLTQAQSQIAILTATSMGRGRTA